MTFGQKLCDLRKRQGLSQEQLSNLISVSRQAVSKWELDAAKPDIENVLQLSNLFHVSTDYLLRDDIDSDMDLPAVKAKSDYMEREYRCRIALISSIGVAVVGLLLTGVFWYERRSALLAGIGFAIQLLGVILFELLISRYGGNAKTRMQKRFYSILVWLILPTPSAIFASGAISLWAMKQPVPYASLFELAISSICYLSICTLITILLNRKKKERDRGSSKE